MVNFRKGQTDTILLTPDFKPLNMLELRASEFELVPNRFLIPMLQYIHCDPGYYILGYISFTSLPENVSTGKASPGGATTYRVSLPSVAFSKQHLIRKIMQHELSRASAMWWPRVAAAGASNVNQHGKQLIVRARLAGTALLNEERTGAR